MRSSANVQGHPIHPMLIPFPFAYLFGSAVVDTWARATHRPTLFRTARHLNTMGLATALAAAVPGLIDYTFTVPPESSARKRATNHMMANLAALALFAVARIGRDRDGQDAPPPWWSLAIETVGAGVLTAGGWIGGTLVTRKWRVESQLPEHADREGWIDAGASGELKADQMKLLRVGTRRIVLARTERGYVAFDDRCTHKGGPLSDGVLACDTVQCPWHGSQFDVRTGAVRHGPAQDSIATYDTEERAGRVWINLPAPARTTALGRAL
jgi:nitrite reductase/ring-hydroxylating ferredoxin subunit/uncharacterized membrane protein